MKRILLFALLLFIACEGSALGQKRFVNKHGEATKDSTKAVSFFLYKRQPDSSWLAVQYNMADQMIFKGGFWDEELTFRHGKATYYQMVRDQVKVSEHESVIDTVLRVSSTGYYNNGQKDGVWTDFFADGSKHQEINFAMGTLDGHWVEYFPTGLTYLEGVYAKGGKQGDWFMYYPDGNVRFYSTYKNGRKIEGKFYELQDRMHGASPNFDFVAYIKQGLKQQGIKPFKGDVLVSFDVGEDGKVSGAKLDLGVDKVLDDAIIQLINQSKPWDIAKLKGKPVTQKINLSFSYDE